MGRGDHPHPGAEVEGAADQPGGAQGRVPRAGRGVVLAGAARAGLARAGGRRIVSLFRRRPKLSAALRPALDADERVLAWAAIDDGTAVVVTNRGLWLPERDRLGWHDIHK